MALDLVQDCGPRVRGRSTARRPVVKRRSGQSRRRRRSPLQLTRSSSSNGASPAARRGWSPDSTALSPRPLPAPPLPPDHAVVAVDGSHIDVDRNLPLGCYVINTGYVSLRYGELPGADLWNEPTVALADDDLSILDSDSLREQPIEGPVLGMLRAVMEVEALPGLVRAAPEGLPVLALLDGSLILWGLTGGAYPDFVRDHLLGSRLLPALDETARPRRAANAGGRESRQPPPQHRRSSTPCASQPTPAVGTS